MITDQARHASIHSARTREQRILNLVTLLAFFTLTDLASFLWKELGEGKKKGVCACEKGWRPAGLWAWTLPLYITSIRSSPAHEDGQSRYPIDQKDQKP